VVQDINYIFPIENIPEEIRSFATSGSNPEETTSSTNYNLDDSQEFPPVQ